MFNEFKALRTGWWFMEVIDKFYMFVYIPLYKSFQTSFQKFTLSFRLVSRIWSSNNDLSLIQ